MTSDQVLVEVAVRLKNIENKVDQIRCPSPKCALHEERMGQLENDVTILQTNEANRVKQGDSKLVIYGILLSTVMSFTAIIVTIWMTFGD